MNSTSRLTVAMSMVTTMACGNAGNPAELILVGGRVWTGSAWGGAAVAVRGREILRVGTDAEVSSLAGPDTREIDLAGRLVLPGFIDSHTHFITGGFGLSSVQLRDAATPEEFVRRIGAFAAAHPGDWITGGTWDHELWGGELPDRSWIDSVTPDTPVFVSRLDGHMALANTRAIDASGVGSDTPDPPGGMIVRGEGGRPTGIFKDAAQVLIERAIPEPTDSMLDRAVDAAARHALEQGVTMVTDMGSWAGLRAYRRAHRAGRLPLRVYSVVPIATWERLASFVRNEGRGDDWLRWGGVKGFVDGSLGSTTAWFYEPYADDPETAGFMVVSDPDALASNIREADSAGLHVIIHAIGDRANDWLLDTFDSAREANGERERRFRVEHAQHLTRESIRRFAESGVIASMQPYHAIDDGRWAEKRIGSARLRTTYAFRSLLDAGATVTFGSDWTVAPVSPLLGIYAAVTRRTLDGVWPEGWVPEEKITVAEAVWAYTGASAFGNFMDDRLGALEEGRLADLVVLSEDIFAIPPEGIGAVQVDYTVVGGDIRFDRTQRD